MKNKGRREQGGTKNARGHALIGPLVSIITVSRNAEKTIAKTIESVLNQSYSNVEYIVIDGGSTDGTIDIVKRYEPKFKGRLRWISENDDGIYDAMNKGIGLARGDIVGLINSDDWYEPEAANLVVDSFREHGNAVYYGIIRVMEHEREVMLKAVNSRYLWREVVAHPAYFVARPIYLQHGVFRTEYKFAADYELMMRLVMKQVPFIQIDKVLATFSQGGESAMHGLETLEELIKIRYQYGYVTNKKMIYQILKNRVIYALRRMNIDI